jgi:hypothetical protein
MPRKIFVLLTSATLCGLSTVPAVADSGSSGLGTSYAAAADVTPGTGIAATLAQTGDIADLLDFLAPVSDQFVAPVTSALADLSTTMTSDLAADLNDAYMATSGDNAQSAPSDGSFPDCGSDGWTSNDCYSATSITSAVNPVVSVTAARAEGYAAADSNAATAAARTTDVDLSALGVDVGTLGTATSTTACPDSGDCTTSSSFDNVRLLGGAVQAKTADDGSVQVAVNGGDFQPVSDLADGTTVSDGDLSATVQPVGDAVEVSIDLTLDQLLTGLGVADDLADLSAYDAGSTITLDVILGGQDAGASNSRGSGVRVGIGVSADIEISVLGLVGDSVTVTDTPTGNVTDLQLAFTTANGPTAEDDNGPVHETNAK